MRDKVLALVEDRRFEFLVMAVIIINGAVLGLLTSRTLSPDVVVALEFIDRLALAFFVVEISLRAYAYGRANLRDAWFWFDAIIIGVAFVPTSGGVTALRVLRILRVFRLVRVVPSLRVTVTALLSAIPGLGSVVALLLIVFYAFAVIETELFGEAFPEFFGTLGRSMYTNFQIMTLESWSQGIVRPVMTVYPWAWAVFVPFVIVTSFSVLNLVIGVIVSSLEKIHQAEAAEHERELAAFAVQEHRQLAALLKTEMRAMEERVLQAMLQRRKDDREC